MIGSNVWYDDIDNISDTPIIFACMTNNIELTRSCIERGDDINQTDKHDVPAVQVAATWGSDLVLQYLIDNNAIIDNPLSLLLAINMGVSSPHVINNRSRSASIIEQIITSYPNLDLNQPINASHRYNLLSSAAMSDYTNSVKVLLKHGAHPQCIQTWHSNPLMFATSNANPVIVRDLLWHGADANFQYDQLHPIMWCITNIATYAFPRPMRMSIQFSGYLGLQSKVIPGANLTCFILLITNGARYKPDNMLIKHIEQHNELKDHKHYAIMSSQEQQEYYANLFTRIKERWWVRKVIRSNWYDRAMQKVYKPGVGAGYFSAMSNIDNLLQNT